MNVELVRVETADGMFLDGALSLAGSSSNSADAPFDSVLLLHGVGSNFYQPRLLRQLAESYDAAGCWTLRGNTRGHDTIHTVATMQGAKRQGAALERVSECLLDIDAWLRLLADRGRQRVLLLGHSLGAIKAVYWAAARRESDTPVAGLAALSPPRLSAEAFGESAPYLESLQLAHSRVSAGKGDELIDVTFPFPMPISAATYVDKYGGERYNIVKLVGDLRVPTLFTYGERELSHGPFAGLPDRLQERCGDADIKVTVVDGADHSYTGCDAEVADAIARRFAM